MLPAVNEPVYLIDADGEQSPGIVVPAQRGEALVVRVDEGNGARIGSQMGLTWSTGSDVFRLDVLVTSRGVRDGAPAVDLKPQGEITKVQRRRYVRVPVTRPISIEVDPLPLESPDGSLTRASGLTLDVSEASVCCSLNQRHAEAFEHGATVRVRFDLDDVDYDVCGQITQVRHLTDDAAPRLELVVMMETSEAQRTSLRRSLFAEQIRMRTTS